MFKLEFLKKYQSQEDKMLISRLFDKIEEVNNKKKIVYTDFLDMHEQSIVNKELKYLKIPYTLWGGFEGATRQGCVCYPQFVDEQLAKKEYSQNIQIIRITLPTSLKGTYEHRIYLSGIMKLGIKRQKVGDIICDENGADIIVTNELSKYIKENLESLTRFSKCKFEILPIDQIRKVNIQKQEIEILVQSLRIDNIVAELLNISRSKTEEYLQSKKIFINYDNDFKSSKLLKEKDIIVIRGKGKFEFDEIIGTTKKNKYILKMLKYV